jgi:hypothetical protein
MAEGMDALMGEEQEILQRCRARLDETGMDDHGEA